MNKDELVVFLQWVIEVQTIGLQLIHDDTFIFKKGEIVSCCASDQTCHQNQGPSDTDRRYSTPPPPSPSWPDTRPSSCLRTRPVADTPRKM